MRQRHQLLDSPWFVGIVSSLIVALFSTSVLELHSHTLQHWAQSFWAKNVPTCHDSSTQPGTILTDSIPSSPLVVRVSLRLPGECQWHESANVSSGQDVQWLVHVWNGSTENQSHVVASVLVPPHLSPVPGSAKWYNAAQYAAPFDLDQLMIDDGAGGYDFGNYAPHGDFLLRFDTRVGGGFSKCLVSVRMIAQAKSAEQPETSAQADLSIAETDCLAS